MITTKSLDDLTYALTGETREFDPTHTVEPKENINASKTFAAASCATSQGMLTESDIRATLEFEFWD